MIIPSEQFWNSFRKTNGALSCAEAIAIVNIALQAPQGVYLEMGTFCGKSAMSAMVGLQPGEFILLEPLFENGEASLDFSNFPQKKMLVKPLIEYSEEYLAKPLGEMYAYVFSDAGSHQDGLPLREVKLLEDRIVSGGVILFHDFRSQFVEVEGAYYYLLDTGKYAL